MNHIYIKVRGSEDEITYIFALQVIAHLLAYKKSYASKVCTFKLKLTALILFIPKSF